MKKLLILSYCFFLTFTLNAQVSKTMNIPSGGLKAGAAVTEPKAAPMVTDRDKTDAHLFESSPIVMDDLERAVHGNQQMIDGFLNRPSINQELLSLAGNDKMKARQLILELEQKIRMGAVPNPNSPMQPGLNNDSNSKNALQLEKVRQLNRLLDSNDQVRVKNENTSSEVNRLGMDYSKSEQRFELSRMETEQQIRNEMENYRYEILDRLIKEEYYRLINDQTVEVPDSNMGRTSRLAKYKTLREMLQEQMSRRNKPGIPNSGQPKMQTQERTVYDNLLPQLELKIREEEQRAEMINRHRMEMEMRIEQEHQKQLPVENKK